MHASAITLVVEGPYVRDILSQPDVLGATIAALRDYAIPAGFASTLRAGGFRRVVLTGMGSSFHALYPLHLSLAARGVASFWVETSELLGGFDGVYAKETLLVVVSQSGESAEVVGLLKRKARFGHVIGVTNDEASTLARAADTVLPMRAGHEASVTCKTYLATLAVLHWLGQSIAGRDTTVTLEELEDVRRRVGEYLNDWRYHVGAWAKHVVDVDAVFVTGRGSSLATAGTGGLILKESTGRAAEGMSSAAFRHGPLEMAGARTLVVIIAGAGNAAANDERLYADILTGGGRAVLVGADASRAAFRTGAVPAPLRPMLEMLPVQMLSLAIAARDGREAGVFVRASKVTTTA